jgi:hypothetical protein
MRAYNVSWLCHYCSATAIVASWLAVSFTPPSLYPPRYPLSEPQAGPDAMETQSRFLLFREQNSGSSLACPITWSLHRLNRSGSGLHIVEYFIFFVVITHLCNSSNVLYIIGVITGQLCGVTITGLFLRRKASVLGRTNSSFFLSNAINRLETLSVTVSLTL